MDSLIGAFRRLAITRRETWCTLVSSFTSSSKLLCGFHYTPRNVFCYRTKWLDHFRHVHHPDVTQRSRAIDSRLLSIALEYSHHPSSHSTPPFHLSLPPCINGQRLAVANRPGVATHHRQQTRGRTDRPCAAVFWWTLVATLGKLREGHAEVTPA